MDKNPKVLIRVDSTKNVAIGHFKRCISLAQMLDREDIPVSFMMRQDEYAQGVLNEHGFHHIFLEEGISSIEDCRQALEAARRLAAEIIIIDSYDIDNDYRKNIMDNGFFLVSLTDTGYMNLVSDVIVNGNLNAEKSKYKVLNKTGLFLGIKYLILSKDYWQPDAEPLPLAALKNIFITMGGIDHYDLTTKILVILDKCEGDFDITAVAGPYYDNIASIKSQINVMRKKVNLINSPATLYPYIKNCSFAFSAGGQTLYELAVLGRPTIGIMLWKNQEGNVKELSKTGSILSVIYSSGKEFEAALTRCANDLITDGELRQRLSETAAAQVDGKGAERVNAMILNTYQKWVNLSKRRNLYA